MTPEILTEIHERVLAVADLLAWGDVDYYHFDVGGGDVDLFREPDSAECFPMAFLAMSDDEIRATAQGQKAEAARLKAENEARIQRAAAIRAAEREVKAARAAEGSAAVRARHRRIQAEKRLATLRMESR